ADAELAAVERRAVDRLAGHDDGRRPPRLVHAREIGANALRHAERVARVVRRAQRMRELDRQEARAERCVPLEAAAGEDHALRGAEEDAPLRRARDEADDAAVLDDEALGRVARART